MAKRFIQVVFITMPTPAPAGRRPRVRLRSTTIAYRNHRDDTKTRDAPPASPRSHVDGRGHAAGRSLPPPSPHARAPIRYRALATTRRFRARDDASRLGDARPAADANISMPPSSAVRPLSARPSGDGAFAIAHLPRRHSRTESPFDETRPLAHSPALSFADRSFATLPATTVRRPRNRPSLSVPERHAPSLRSSGGARR